MRTALEPKHGPANGLEPTCSPESSESSAASAASDGEPSGGGGGSGFGVSVCLRRVLGAADPRARCLVWVEPGRRARCLLRRLRRLCGVPAASELCLLVRGHWLPPDEPLTLLRPGDQLELLPLEEGAALSEEAPPEAPAGGGGGEGAAAAELERGKKRALGLLERLGEGAEGAEGAEGGAPPPARRRRRHRRAARRSPPPPAPAPAPEGGRAPRVVRAMPPSPPPPPAAPAAPASSPGVAESTEAPE